MPVARPASATLALLALAAAPAAAPAQAPPPRATDGTIVTAAGTTPGFAGDGGPATQALLNTPRDVALTPGGATLVADLANNRIRRIAPDGTIFTVAGTGNGQFGGDGGPATDADLDRPRGVTALPDGGYLIADTFNDRIRRVWPDGTITTVAGGGAGPGLGDGGPATSARLSIPGDTALLPGGGYLIADTGDGRIRRVAPDGTITTLAAQLNQPRDVAVAADGTVLVADTGNDRVVRVAADGTVTTLAGGNGAGFSGDGTPARGAQLRQPFGVEPTSNGGFLIADTGNDRVRRVTPLGAIFTVAGTGGGLAGDGGQAKTARLAQPAAVALAPSGGFLVADTVNARVRQVSALGAIPNAVTGRSVYLYPAALGPSVAPAGTPSLVPLREEDLVPTGSAIDATTGRIEVRTSADATGGQQTAQVYSGPFTVTQAGRATAPITLFRLPSLTDCGTGARAARVLSSPFAHAAAKKKRKRRRGSSRRIWVTEKGGRWRTSTGSVSAAAIGTDWVTTLQCDGVRVTVREGRVAVRDKIRNRTRVVRAGQSLKITTPASRAGQ